MYLTNRSKQLDLLLRLEVDQGFRAIAVISSRGNSNCLGENVGRVDALLSRHQHFNKVSAKYS